MAPQIEIETIKESSRKALISMLNKIIQETYDVIINYPRIVDYFANIEKIEDEQLLSDLQKIGEESKEHLNWVVEIIKSLGGEPEYKVSVVERMYDHSERRGQQLEKEKKAIESYKRVISYVRSNVAKEKVEELNGKYFKKAKKGFEEEIFTATEIINKLQRIQYDEVKHVRMIEDMIATYDYLTREKES